MRAGYRRQGGRRAGVVGPAFTVTAPARMPVGDLTADVLRRPTARMVRLPPEEHYPPTADDRCATCECRQDGSRAASPPAAAKVPMLARLAQPIGVKSSHKGWCDIARHDYGGYLVGP